jgi:hypothetical protein
MRTTGQKDWHSVAVTIGINNDKLVIVCFKLGNLMYRQLPYLITSQYLRTKYTYPLLPTERTKVFSLI